MKKISTSLLRFLLYFILIAFTLLLLGSLFQRVDGIGMLKSVQQIEIVGIASVDGGPPQEITDTLWTNNIKRTMVVQGHFTQGIKPGDSLIIWPRNLRIRIYVNGVQKVSTGQRESFPDFIQYAGNSFQMFYIGPVRATDSIRIEIVKAYESCRINVITSFFNNIYAGRESTVYQSIMSNELLHLCIGLFLMVTGFFILLASFSRQLLKLHSIRQILDLGWFCFIGGVCYLFDSSYKYIDLLFPHLVFNTLVDLLCIPLLLYFYFRFITDVLKDQHTKRFMTWVTRCFFLLEIIPFVLQMTGFRDLHVIQDSYIFVGGFGALLGCGSIVYEIIHLQNKDMNKYLYAGLPLLASLTLKIMNVILEERVERTYLRLGILICCILLLRNTIIYFNQTMEVVEHEKQMQEEIKASQVSIMLSQIQPHFLYNTLNALQHICLKDGALAAEAIEHFSKYLRGNLQSLTDDRLIPFTRELEHISHYLYIEQLRFGNRVKIEYDLGYTDFFIPTLTMQPLVENAIRHGITKQAEGGTVTISTRREDNDVWITISDNGVGFNPMESNSNDSRHIGLENVRKRLSYQCDANIEIISTPGFGTQVSIQMKGASNVNHENNRSG